MDHGSSSGQRPVIADSPHRRAATIYGMKLPRQGLILGAVLLTVLMLISAAQVAANVASYQSRCRMENNAAWASVDWTSLPVDAAAVKKLAQDSAAHKIRYLYPFTTFVKEDEFSKAYVH